MTITPRGSSHPCCPVAGAHGQQPRVCVSQEPALQVCVRGGVQVCCCRGFDGVKCSRLPFGYAGGVQEAADVGDGSCCLWCVCGFLARRCCLAALIHLIPALFAHALWCAFSFCHVGRWWRAPPAPSARCRWVDSPHWWKWLSAAFQVHIACPLAATRTLHPCCAQMHHLTAA